VRPVRDIAAALIGLAAAATLSGCVSLLPKSDPAQLYRFGAASAAPATAAPGARKDIILAPVAFTQAASGDRILTFSGPEGAYIKASRWVTPASVLFGEALQRRFASANTVRLADRRQATATSLMLNLSVDTFEARYGGDPKAAPTVVLGMTARIVKFPERTVLAERRFDAEAPASDNRVGAIVTAYDQAVAKGLDELVTWTDTSAR
jgi:cholesterol transport system auxiliary component